MERKYYTKERNVQIVISLLKANGIKRIIASPGTTNMTFVGSIQQDPYFEIYSSVDERSAAYLACGMAAETNEPVVLSCTGATASRNYMPGLTEAYYRKLPILAITSHRGSDQIGHLKDQQIDRRSLPNDIAVESVTIPMAKSPREIRHCEIEANKAILALKLNGGGPVHINLFTEYTPDFSIKELPLTNSIFRYTINDDLPALPQNSKIAIFIGSHHNFSKEEIEIIDNFCESNNSIVFCDHTSGYTGKYAIKPHLIFGQSKYNSPIRYVDLLIHLGEVCGTNHPFPKEVWRISEDGCLRDTFGKLTKVFMMPEKSFFKHYITKGEKKLEYYNKCVEEKEKILSYIPDLPFGNIWIAQQTIGKLPQNSELHMGIFNSLRSWSFFDLPKGVLGKCNVGGFGIDGGLSTMIGASIIRRDKTFFGVFGDLAFFYDMNVLGNRHIGNNIRIMLINNSRGTEFRLNSHPCAIFGEEADPYMAAYGHFGKQSPTLVKGIAESLGFIYLTAKDKDSFLNNINTFLDTSKTAKCPIIFEIFTNTSNESEALELIQNTYIDKKREYVQNVGKLVRKIAGEKGINLIKKYTS